MEKCKEKVCVFDESDKNPPQHIFEKPFSYHLCCISMNDKIDEHDFWSFQENVVV